MKFKSWMFSLYNFNSLSINFFVNWVQSVSFFARNPIWFFRLSSFLVNVSFTNFQCNRNFIIFCHLHFWNYAIFVWANANYRYFVWWNISKSCQINLLQQLALSVFYLNLNAKWYSFNLCCFISEIFRLLEHNEPKTVGMLLLNWWFRMVQVPQFFSKKSIYFLKEHFVVSILPLYESLLNPSTFKKVIKAKLMIQKHTSQFLI